MKTDKKNYEFPVTGVRMSYPTVRVCFIMLFLTLISIILLTACVQPVKLNSQWRDHEIVIDGLDSEWENTTVYIPKQKISLTLLNDQHNLYIRLASRDRRLVSQVMGMGFTLWLDPHGGKRKTFGIHFPLGMQDMERPAGAMMPGDNPDEFVTKFPESMVEMEILGPGKEESRRIRLSAAEIQGLHLKIGFVQGNLVYELQVPFFQDELHPLGIGLDPTDMDTNQVIGMGFETSEFDMSKMKNRMEGENPGGFTPEGGTGAPPGGGPGMGGGPQGVGMPGGGMKPERLNLWSTVKLASKSSVQK